MQSDLRKERTQLRKEGGESFSILLSQQALIRRAALLTLALLSAPASRI